MSVNLGIFLVIVALGPMIMVVVTTVMMVQIVTPPVSAANQKAQSYFAILDNQEPKKNASGIVRLAHNATNNDQISYQVNLTSVNKVVMVDIHQDSITGPVVAILFMSSSTRGEEQVNGVLAQDSITSPDLRGPLEGASVQHLIHLFNQQKAFVTVHTSDTPSGELIGTIMSSNSSET